MAEWHCGMACGMDCGTKNDVNFATFFTGDAKHPENLTLKHMERYPTGDPYQPVAYTARSKDRATLSVYPHRARLKNIPGHGGNRTYDLWNTNPMLCQLSYAVRSVRVCDISELNLVPSIQCNLVIMIFSVLVLCTEYILTPTQKTS